MIEPSVQAVSVKTSVLPPTAFTTATGTPVRRASTAAARHAQQGDHDEEVDQRQSAANRSPALYRTDLFTTS